MGIIKFTSGQLSSDFSANDDGTISKQGLVFYAGKHIDSKGREWVISQEKLERIVDNTNALFNSGKRIPVLKDHKRDMDHTVGDLNSTLIIREIKPEDLGGKHKDLIGKLGAFATDVVIKATDTVAQIKQGIANTISPGIDMVKDLIEEISLTPNPAIQGLSLFMNGEDNALTWDDIESCSKEKEELREEYQNISDKLFELLCNIMKSEVPEIETLVNEALMGFTDRVTEIFELDAPEEQMPQMMNYSKSFSENVAEFQRFSKLNTYNRNKPLSMLYMNTLRDAKRRSRMRGFIK